MLVKPPGASGTGCCTTHLAIGSVWSGSFRVFEKAIKSAISLLLGLKLPLNGTPCARLPWWMRGRSL